LSLSIDYTAPSLRMPLRARFRYRLFGADADWVEAGPGRVASYTGLSPGSYRFAVQAQNEDGVTSTRDATLSLSLPPPLSRRPWFVLLCLLGSAGLLHLTGRFVAHRHERRERELSHMVDRRTADLQSEVRERQRAEDALRRSHDQLEDRVRERTAQLATELAERTRLQLELMQARKLEAMGRLAGGVAHDLNNMLTAIINFADFAGDAASDPRQKEDILGIREAARQAAELAGRLLVVARRQLVTPRRFDINALIKETVKLLGPTLGPKVRVELVLLPTVCPVFADPGQVEQVLINLALNARDAMPGGGPLRIETDAVSFSSSPAEPVEPGAYVCIRVADQGCGMSAEVLSHLFEPFFTTKPKGTGTGLGLATCYGIVRQGRGHIAVRSEVGQGTQVSVYLPS
jgi:signal transduction histidine kinase